MVQPTVQQKYQHKCSKMVFKFDRQTLPRQQTQKRNLGIIDQRKIANYRMQQAQTLSEKKETKNEYLNLNRQVKRSCTADKNK